MELSGPGQKASGVMLQRTPHKTPNETLTSDTIEPFRIVKKTYSVIEDHTKIVHISASRSLRSSDRAEISTE